MLSSSSIYVILSERKHYSLHLLRKIVSKHIHHLSTYTILSVKGGYACKSVWENCKVVYAGKVSFLPAFHKRLLGSTVLSTKDCSRKGERTRLQNTVFYEKNITASQAFCVGKILFSYLQMKKEG